LADGVSLAETIRGPQPGLTLHFGHDAGEPLERL
jgi:hypothetical protein